MKIILFLTCVFAFTLHASVFPQGTTMSIKANDQTIRQINVTGTVTDENGEPLLGVSVSVKGTTRGSITNQEGEYSILVPDPSTTVLVFSFVGYLTQEILVGNQSTIQVTMMQDLVGLEEVVVIGYGTQLKTTITGSIAQINSEDLDIEKRPVTSIQTALVGTLPGLRGVHSNGNPGVMPNFDIRGVSSTNSTNPLIIIDGFEGSLSNLDPNSVESISILKDASTVSIYGARGANGVMLVTTKQGNRGEKLKVTYKYAQSIQTPQRLPELVNSLEYMQIQNEAQVNDGTDPANVTYTQALLDKAASGFYPETNWAEEMYLPNAGQYSHNIAVMGGTENTAYLLDAGYLKQNGLNVGSDNFDRINLHLNIDSDINDWLTIGTTTLITNRLHNNVPVNTGYSNRGLPFFPVKTDDGEWVYKGGPGPPNVIAAAASGSYDKSQIDALSSQIYAKVSPIAGLTIEERISYTKTNTNRRVWNNVYDYVVLDETDPDFKAFVPGDGAARNLNLTASRDYSLRTLTTANYNFSIREDHHGHVLLGFQSEQGEYESFQTGRKGYALESLQDLSLGELINDAIGGGVGNTSTWGGNVRTLSYFGRVNYDYGRRYLAEFSFRVDGSSNFSKANQWGFFPAVAVGWNIAQESFFDNIPFVNRFKLRASYGQSGDDSGVGRGIIQLVNYDATGYAIGGIIQPSLSLGNPANADLRWETAEILNIGVDLSLWQGKLQVQYDYFINNRFDILDFLQTPQEFGLGDVPGNVYDVKSWGWELDIRHMNKIGQIGYWASFNITDYNNEVTNLYGRGPIIGGDWYRDVGLPINNHYGYETDGFFDDQAEIDDNVASDGSTPISQTAVGGSFVGGFKFVDQNDDGVVNADDRIILDENSNANYFMGAGLGASYKGFSLSARFYGVLDRNQWWTSVNANGLFPNVLTPFRHMADYWKPDNQDALFPLAENSVAPYPMTNSHFLHKNEFIKMKNITLSYAFNQALLEKIKFIHGLEIFASVENLGTVWTNSPVFDTGWDPELSVGAIDYPLPVTTSFSVNITF